MAIKSNFSIAIIGRPNVGKSTLFNKLVGRKLAIVDNTPGVTRDRKEGSGNIGPYNFQIIDTAGLERKKNNLLVSKMVEQTTKAIELCDLVIFMIDGIAGVLEEDKYYGNWLRKFDKNIILVVNKCENSKKISHLDHDLYKLGFGEAAYISAEHKLGFNDLIDNISPYLENHEQKEESQTYEDLIQLSIIGRPNAGKSTLVNSFLNQERTITSPEAGTTRDAIAIDWNYGNYKIKLVDTAGIRKRTKINCDLEKMSVKDAENAVNFSHIVIMIIDATMFLEHQDLSIIDYAIKEGRGIVIAANKWDLVKNQKDAKKEIEYQIKDHLKSIDGVHIEYISALHSDNLDKLMQAVIHTYSMWNKRINTADLNKWIKEATDNHPIPMNSQGKRPKIKFLTQYKSRPPSFMLHSNYPDDIDNNYQRYLTHSLRAAFNLTGVPIRFSFKKSSNPYSKGPIRN